MYESWVKEKSWACFENFNKYLLTIRAIYTDNMAKNMWCDIERIETKNNLWRGILGHSVTTKCCTKLAFLNSRKGEKFGPNSKSILIKERFKFSRDVPANIC